MNNEQKQLVSVLERRIKNIRTWEEIEENMQKTYEKYGYIPTRRPRGFGPKAIARRLKLEYEKRDRI